MITYNYFGKEQKIYYEKLPNGLDVYVVPNNNRVYLSGFSFCLEKYKTHVVIIIMM